MTEQPDKSVGGLMSIKERVIRGVTRIRGGPRASRPGIFRVLRDWIQPVAILIGGFWVAAVWIYDNYYLPSLIDPHLSLSASAEIVGEGGDHHLLRVTIGVLNEGSKPAYNNLNTLNILGYEVEPVAGKGGHEILRATRDLLNEHPGNAPYLARAGVELSRPTALGTGSVLRRPLAFWPGQEVRRQHMVTVTKGIDYVEVIFKVIHGQNEDRDYPKFEVRDGSLLAMGETSPDAPETWSNEARSVVAIPSQDTRTPR